MPKTGPITLSQDTTAPVVAVDGETKNTYTDDASFQQKLARVKSMSSRDPITLKKLASSGTNLSVDLKQQTLKSQVSQWQLNN